MDGKFLTFLWGEPPQRLDEAVPLGVFNLRVTGPGWQRGYKFFCFKGRIILRHLGV